MAYFLNPYTIWLSAIVGHYEQLMMAFVLLAYLYLLKERINYSAICLSVATFFRYVPILLLPSFLVYLWRINKSDRRHVIRFFLVYLTASLALLIPYFIIVLTLYRASWEALLYWLGWWQHAFGTGGATAYGFFRNFTTFFAELGIWPSISPFFGWRTFIPLYFIVTFFMLRQGSPSPTHLINRYAIVVYSLYLILSPLIHHHLLAWILPFLFLETILDRGLPRYIPHILWFSWLAIDPIIVGNFLYYPMIPGLLPSPNTWPITSTRAYPLLSALSVISGLFLMLSTVACLKRWGFTDIKASTIEVKRRVVRRPRIPIFCAFFMTVLLLSYSLLIWNSLNGSISNDRSYWTWEPAFSGSYVSSHGYVNSVADGGIVVGDREYEESSCAIWKIVVERLPFMSDQLKKAVSVSLSIKGKLPVTYVPPYNVAWKDDDFKSDWIRGETGAVNCSFATDGNTATITGVFKTGVSGSIWIVKEVPNVSSTDFPYIGFMAYVRDGTNSNWMVETLDENGQTIAYWCGNNIDWETFTRELPSGKIVRYITLRVENNRPSGWTGEGAQYAYFNYVMLRSKPISPRWVQVSINNCTVFLGNLTFEKDGLFTLPPNEYKPTITLPISMLKVESFVNLTVWSCTSWEISSVSVNMHTNIGNVHPPVWQLIPYHTHILFVAFGLEIIVALMMLNKFRKWMKTVGS